jgi:hypothetical protein
MAVNTERQEIDILAGLAIIQVDDAINSGADADDLYVGAAVLYMLEIRNTANLAQKNYCRFYNSTAAAPGTDAPEMSIPCTAGATVRMSIHPGYSFGTGISIGVGTTGGTAGATAPTSDVGLTLVATT